MLGSGELLLFLFIDDLSSKVTEPLATETGAGEEFLKGAARSAGTSGGNKGSAGRSAGSSAVACIVKENGTASSTPPGTQVRADLKFWEGMRRRALLGPAGKAL